MNTTTTNKPDFRTCITVRAIPRVKVSTTAETPVEPIEVKPNQTPNKIEPNA